MGVRLQHLAVATTFETYVWNIPSHELLQTNDCTRNSKIMQYLFEHCERLGRISYCTNHCDREQLLRRHPVRNPPPLRTPKVQNYYIHTIDTEIKAKQNNMISELITFRITKAKANV